MAIRLLIAEDHPWVREGLRATFQNTEIEVGGEATTGEEAIDLAIGDGFDVMLLDIKMPGCDGFEVLEKVKSEKSDLRVLIYSQHDRPDFQVRARQLAASGYLVKTAHKDELIDAIRRVGHGECLWDSPDSRSQDG
jgi:DNA-binding NarL/FixJ family response regulator